MSSGKIFVACNLCVVTPTEEWWHDRPWHAFQEVPDYRPWGRKWNLRGEIHTNVIAVAEMSAEITAKEGLTWKRCVCPRRLRLTTNCTNGFTYLQSPLPTTLTSFYRLNIYTDLCRTHILSVKNATGLLPGPKPLGLPTALKKLSSVICLLF